MSKTKLLTITLILLSLTFAQTLFTTSTFSASAATTTSTSTQLKIFIGPTSVPADNQAYNIITVQLQNSKGTPVRAQEDATISLSSSLTNIGTVDPTVTIPKDSTGASSNFYTTYTPGTTTITAAASGYSTVQATVTTIGPIPTALAIYAFPQILPADGGDYKAIIVQLQDSTGAPAKAPTEGIQITLSSSNAAVATVDASVTIQPGKTYATANIKTISVGTASITATSSGYTTAQTTINVQQPAGSPTNLKIYLAPPKVPADGETYEQVTVQLQDSKGKLSQFPTDTQVTLASSSTAIGTTEPTITIKSGQSFALAKFHTTYKSGTTTLTATATNCTSNQATITTFGPVPSKLAVYTLPTALPADGKAYDAIQVQLQDSRGKPAKDPAGDITVNLFSSTPEAGNVSSTLTIPFGETHATGSFNTNCAATSTTITAQASGYESGQAKLTTYLIDRVFLNVSLTSDFDTVTPGNNTTISAYVTYNGTYPALKAALNFTSNKGGNFTTPKDEGNGYYTTIYTAPKVSTQTVCTITVNVAKTGYNGTSEKMKITVDLYASHGKGTLQLRIMEDENNPISEAAITSQSQPTGAQTLSGVTNKTGFITFINVSEGDYTIQVAKSGFETKTETIQFTTSSQPTYHTINLSKADSGIFSLPVIVAIIAVAVVSAVLVFWVIRKRRNEEITE